MASPCHSHQDQIVAKGTLTSPYFEIRSSNLTFLIGGGCDISTTRVELLIDGETKLKSTGDCTQRMTTKYWITSPYVGKLARIQIVDESAESPWGFTTFDDLRSTSNCQDLQECKSNQSMCIDNKDMNNDVICRCSSSHVGPLPCGSNNKCNITGGSCQSICSTADCACQECSCSSGYHFNATSLTCLDINECAANSGGCQYACVNTIGGYHCACRDGYHLDNDKKSCVDIDECKVVQNGGCQNSLCSNREGGFECICYQGFEKNSSDPLRCIDIDECVSPLCGSTQICVNTLGSYRCKCPFGNKLNNQKKCVDINECDTMNGGCDHMCTNVPASFTCSCRSGYKLAPNRKKCLDENECETDNGRCQQRCHNNDGSYECGCDPGYLLSNDSLTCLDINECAIDGICAHKCTNTNGGYTCSCRHGYKLHHDNHTCLDVNECSSNNGNCTHGCYNNPGGYNCTCNHGYSLLDDERTCIDINECVINNQCEHICTNIEGSFNCSCFPGFKLQNDSTSCLDINECEENSDELCQHICTNSPGSYHCSCPAGYELNNDNKTCTDINECENKSTCEHNCTNLIGSFRCSCLHGYDIGSDNKSCLDINECLQNNICTQQCHNSEGSYHCACSNGYVLGYDNRSCLDVDECQNNNVCQEFCTNTVGSYRCSCHEGKILQSDGKTCRVIVPLNKALDTATKGIEDASSSSVLSEICKDLSNSIADTKDVTSKNLEDTLQFIDKLESKIKNEAINVTVKSTQTLVVNYAKVVNNLLEPENKPSWKNITKDTASIVTIPTKVEHFAESIFHLVKSKNISEVGVSVQDENIALQMNFTHRQSFKGYKYEFGSSKLKLDDSLVKDTDNNDIIGITVVMYKSFGEFLSKKLRNVNSDIISIKVMNVSKDHLSNLSYPVIMHFNHLKTLDNAEQKCAFLNESAADMNSESLWSSEGCWVNSTHGNVTVCMCNHTTSYGLLMDVHGIYDSLHDTHKDALKYISLVGCCVSICFCVLTVVALTLTMRHPMEKKGRFETFKLHINLVVAIGLSQIWFVIGSFLVNVDLVACRVVSIFTHYFLTASFCWMLVEGINVYNKIVKVFSTKKYGKFYFTLGWGFPLVTVIVTSAAVFNKYGPQNICWLHKDVIWVFAVPVMVVIVANFFVLLSVVYVLLRKTMAFSSTPNKPKENPKVRRTVKVTVVLLPLLGLTWVFGFLAIDKNFIVFHYLFAIVNSLQGFFIFIAHCWINDSIRSALLEKLPSLPSSSKYQSSTKSGGRDGEADTQRPSQVESNAFDNDVTCSASVPMPSHITMSTVQLLNLEHSSDQQRKLSQAISDCLEQDNQLPGFAQ